MTTKDSREAAIRLVVAVQWGEAIALHDRFHVDSRTETMVVFDLWSTQRLSALPCAVDVVDAFWPRGEV
jgi:hypothetical protein